MTGNVLPFGPEAANPAIARCREIIRAGGIIVYPTDTFYALGGDPRIDAAVRRLFRIKGRQEDQPILLLIAEHADVLRWAKAVNRTAERLMERFWPGPLTLVFAARPDVPGSLTGGTGTIGIRMPGNPLTRSLIAGVGTALTGTSANRTGESPPRSAAAALESLGSDVDLVLDAGQPPTDLPSTVVDVRNDAPAVIRRGVIDEKLLL